MGADSETDEGLELSEDSEDSKEDEEEDGVIDGDLVDGGLPNGVATGAAGLVVDEQAVAKILAGGIGGHSRNTTPTNFVELDGDGGVGIMAPDELPLALMPPLKFITQQTAKGAVVYAPLK